MLTALLLLLLRNRYWIGTGCFGTGIADCRRRGDLRHRRDPSVRAERGGCLRRHRTMTALTTAVLVSGIVLLALGVVLLALHLKGQRSESGIKATPHKACA
ncbi:MAG: hypothetical protein ACLUOF_09410 [Ruminococcus sp.]